jgi:hypothetical protein
MFLRIGLLAALLVLTAFCHSTPADDKAEFKPLFNGSDFKGWRLVSKVANSDPKQTWSVSDGVIKCTGKPNGYILTEDEYTNYVLKLKWRFPADSKGGNSGVLLHCTGPNKVWPNSIEAQLKAGFAGDLWLNADEQGKLPTLLVDLDRKDTANKEGRHYFRIQGKEPIEKPFGEWNEYVITSQDGAITLEVNGKKANVGKSGSLKTGRIAVQSEGAEIHFKEIEIQVRK